MPTARWAAAGAKSDAAAGNKGVVLSTKDPLVVFTPSGRRGRFPVGTMVLQAARSLGVDIVSV